MYNISNTLPSRAALEANAEMLARYAALCQSMGIVPIVEPEVLIDGDHTIERSAEVNEAVIAEVFNALRRHRVQLETMILKPSMVTPGKACAKASPEEVAEATLRVFRKVVPAAIPGISFLSGGQTPEEATLNLNALNSLGPLPWYLSFFLRPSFAGTCTEGLGWQAGQQGRCPACHAQAGQAQRRGQLWRL